MKPMVTTNQKSTIVKQKLDRKEPTSWRKSSNHKWRNQKKKERTEKKKIQKQPENKQQNDNKYISVINHVKCQWTKCFKERYKVADWFKKGPSLCYLEETHSELKIHTDWKWGDGKR